MIGPHRVCLVMAGYSAIAHVVTCRKGTAVRIAIIHGPLTVLSHMKVKADQAWIIDINCVMGIMTQETGSAPIFDMRFMKSVKGVGSYDDVRFVMAAPAQGKITVSSVPSAGRRQNIVVLEQRGIG